VSLVSSHEHSVVVFAMTLYIMLLCDYECYVDGTDITLLSAAF